MNFLKKVVFSGVGTALATPFSEGEIDYTALDLMIEEQIAAKVDALIIGGTTGEAATLSTEERYTLYEYAVEKVHGRTRVILGTGTNDTRVAINHTRFAESIGADGALIVTPYYNKGTEEGVYKHYISIADAVKMPIILYNVPSRTGVNLGLNLLARLAEHPNISGLKEAGDSLDRMVALSELRDTLPLYAGNDSQIFPTLSLFGAGVISVVSNLLPKEIKELCESFKRGELERALTIQLKLMPLIRALFTETNPAPLKYALSRLGKSSSELRLPLTAVRASTGEALDIALSDFFH